VIHPMDDASSQADMEREPETEMDPNMDMGNGGDPS